MDNMKERVKAEIGKRLQKQAMSILAEKGPVRIEEVELAAIYMATAIRLLTRKLDHAAVVTTLRTIFATVEADPARFKKWD
jgi:hypothetical protein